ncbi:MAG: exosortase A, partial [Pseudomonadota bacterium]
VCIFALHPTAMSMAQTWLSSSSYHHGIAVAPLAVWMIVSRPRIAPATSPFSLVFVLLSAVLWVAGTAAGVALVTQFAFVSLLIAGAGTIFGAAALRLWVLPLLFLYFMVPFGQVLVPFLQQATAQTVIGLLTLFEMPASLDGVLITTPSGVFEIAEACAGLNFLLAALMIAWVYACQTLSTLRSRTVFLALALAVALMANFIRAFLLITIATLSDMKLAVGPDHLFIGLLFYGAIFFALFWIGGKLQRPRGISPDHAPVSAWRPWHGGIAALALVPVVGASVFASTIVHAPSKLEARATLSPLNAPGWRILGAPENWSPVMNADTRLDLTYQQGRERVYVSIGYATDDHPVREIVTVENRAADGDAWRKIASINEVVYLFGKSEPVMLEVLAGSERRRLLVASVYWRGDQIYTSKIRFKLAQMRDKLQGRNPPGGMIFIASDYAGAPEQALHRIRAFTSDVEGFSAWRARNGGAS